jgi:hypothetical protein
MNGEFEPVNGVLNLLISLGLRYLTYLPGFFLNVSRSALEQK